MTTMDEHVNSTKLTHLLSNFSMNMRALVCTSNFNSKFLIAFLNVHTRDNGYISLMYTMYANALNNTLSYTHVSSSMV